MEDVVAGRSLHRNFICFQFKPPSFIKCLKFDIICGVYLSKRRRKIWLNKKIEEVTKKFGDERKKALDDALKVIEKDFGKGAVMRLGERAEQKVQVMSSGSLALDIALGAGGYPKGRIIEIYGPESSGKTTVALHAVARR